MKPFFSVIIATYNRENLIVRALDSLVSQTNQDWEAWIIDDGSTDNTQQVVERFLGDKVHYFYQENLGDIIAKNKGVSMSNGKYITFLDSDDYYESHHLESRKEIIEKNKSIDLLHGGVKIIGDEYVPDLYNPNEKIHLSECVIGATFFVKRELFMQLEGFEKVNYGSDNLFFNKIEKLGLNIIKSSLPTYIYDRSGSDSITHNFG